jgi:adenylate cyclase
MRQVALAGAVCAAVLAAGRETPVTIFAPLDRTPSQEIIEGYAAGLAAYRAGRFAEALAAFVRVAAQDAPARATAQRVKCLLAAPPVGTWDAIASMETK